MTATRTRRKPLTARQPAKRPTKKKRQRRWVVRNPVTFRSPVVRTKRRVPKRKTTLTAGSVLVAVLGVAAYLLGSMLMLLVTMLTALAAALLAVAGEPSPPKQKRRGPNKGNPRKPAGTPKPPPPGTVMCGAPTRSNGKCMRYTTPGQNCGIPSHPAPTAQQKKPGP